MGERPKVHELVAAAGCLVAALSAAETEEEAVALLDQQLTLEQGIADKLEALHFVQRQLEAQAGVIRAEETALAGRRKRLEAGRARVKALAEDLLRAHADLTGERKVDTGRVSARLVRGNPKVHHPASPASWPGRYVRHEPKLDKARLRMDLQAGAEVEGCRLSFPEHVRWS